MGGETERLEREINAYLTGLPGFDLDVYRDIFSSEYVNNVIYNHPERIRRIQPVLDRLGFIRNTHFVLTMIFDNFWNICQKRDNAYRYQLKRSLLNHTREALGRLHPASVAATRWWCCWSARTWRPRRRRTMPIAARRCCGTTSWPTPPSLCPSA